MRYDRKTEMKSRNIEQKKVTRIGSFHSRGSEAVRLRIEALEGKNRAMYKMQVLDICRQEYVGHAQAPMSV